MASFTFIDSSSTSHTIPGVRLGSKRGFEGNTGTVETISNSTYTAVLMTRINRNSRTIGLTIPVIAATSSALESSLSTYLSWFRQTETPGKLRYTRDDTTSREIPVYIAQGYPVVTYETNTFAWLEVQFIACDPYWSSTTATSITSGTAVTNDGDYPAPLTLIAGASTVTFSGATTGSITSVSGQSISSAVITITDDAVTVVSGTSNWLYKVNINSVFPMLSTGSTTITGASGTFRKRWGSA